MTDREAMQQALEALDGLYLPGELERVNAAITALRERLAQPECDHEDRITMLACVKCGALVGIPPQRKPLTDEECDNLWYAQLFEITDRASARDFIRDVEAAHDIKENT